MALQRNPNDPLDPDRPTTRLDQEMDSGTGLSDTRVTSGRVVLAALAVVVLIGALFYGMNMSSTTPSSTASQNSGTTTGSAPASPQTPASPPSNSTTSPSR